MGYSWEKLKGKQLVKQKVVGKVWRRVFERVEQKES